MSKKAFVTAFNDNFKKLTKTIHQLIPENQSLEAIKNAVHVGAMAKPDMYISHFYTHVCTPFETKIIAKDNEFFLNMDVSRLSSQLSTEQAQEANILRQRWSTFTKEQQDILWQYMIVLTKLSQRWHNA